MDFARKILGKYGWKDGDGLGKNNDGIAKPLKATLKFDNAGFGADQAASNFNNHWWERAFNDAAGNLDVKQEGESIQMSLIDPEDEVEVSTKSYSVKKLKKAKLRRLPTEQSTKYRYDNFLQSSTLNNAGEEVLNPNRIDTSDIEITKVKVLTDEELFKACGGRTAHKGARHGLKQNGKLARLKQQEEELLAKMYPQKNGVAKTEKTKNKQDRKSIRKSDISYEREVENLSRKEETPKQLRKEDTTEIETPARHGILKHRTKKKDNKKSLEETQKEKIQSCDDCDLINDRKVNKKRKKDKYNKMSEAATDEAMWKTKTKEGTKRMAEDAAEKIQSCDDCDLINDRKINKKRKKDKYNKMSEAATDEAMWKTKTKEGKKCMAEDAAGDNTEKLKKTKKNNR